MASIQQSYRLQLLLTVDTSPFPIRKIPRHAPHSAVQEQQQPPPDEGPHAALSPSALPPAGPRLTADPSKAPAPPPVKVAGRSAARRSGLTQTLLLSPLGRWRAGRPCRPLHTRDCSRCNGAAILALFPLFLCPASMPRLLQLAPGAQTSGAPGKIYTAPILKFGGGSVLVRSGHLSPRNPQVRCRRPVAAVAETGPAL
jgi:hypothetical protein